MTDLSGKTAIVTGAASGIGRAIALAFAEAGAKVAVADIAEAPNAGGEPTAAAIGEGGGEAFFQKTDVASEADIDALVAATVSRWGRLDVMVNNAAIFSSKRAHELSLEEWQRVMAVNLTGTFLGCKRAITQMLTQEPVAEARGRIINITSQHGMIAAPNSLAYGVSKAGGVYMTRQIAADYAKDLIICNAVAPGKILTGGPTETVSEERLAYSRARTPLPRLGAPEDVANAALFLASDQASYMTGHNLMVDGGWMAS